MAIIETDLLEEANRTVYQTGIKDVLVISRPTFQDSRGFFKETFRRNHLEAVLGRPVNLEQENHSRSSRGTLRGIHIAKWDKMVYVPNGRVQQVVVDLREDSDTFNKYFSVEIGDASDSGEENRSKVFVPKGCGNGYLVLSETADYMYLTSDYWYPNSEREVAFDDPDMDIEWNISGKPNISERDMKAPSLRHLFPHLVKKSILDSII